MNPLAVSGLELASGAQLSKGAIYP